MKSKASTVQGYLNALPPDRSAVIQAVREVILANLDRGYAEGMQYGMIGYFVPHTLYPAGYHCDPELPLPYAHLASQKNHMSLYLMCIYTSCGKGSAAELGGWFRDAWARTGKKMDMGKACIRFKSLDHLALDVIGETIRRTPVKTYVEMYETFLQGFGKKTRPRKSR